MTFVFAHAAQGWLEAALFAPPAAVVLAAIVKTRRRGSPAANQTKENP